MALSSLHILLTYQCTRECDHCFLFGSPKSRITFTIENLEAVLKQAADMGTVTSVYFEGGEPFLHYDLLLAGIKMASDLGFTIGIVTNGYWAKTEARARELLEPLLDFPITDLSISDDELHSSSYPDSPPKIATRIAKELGIPCGNIEIDHIVDFPEEHEKGQPIIGGGVQFRGRAAEKLTRNLSFIPWTELISCPHENFVDPGRVHVDPLGNIMICQGLTIGNCFEQTLKLLMEEYSVASHPICQYIHDKGPAGLAEAYGIEVQEYYVDECHLCYSVRKSLITRFPQYLTPPNIYGKLSLLDE